MLRRILLHFAPALSIAVLLLAAPSMAVVADPSNDVPHLPRSCVAPEDLIPQEAGACYLSPFKKQRPTIVLWGDSHAWQFIPALRAAVGKRDVNLVAFVMGGCPPMIQAPSKHSLSCEVSNRMALRFTKKLKAGAEPMRVILGASWGRYRSARQQQLLDVLFPQPGSDAYAIKIGKLAKKGTPRLFRQLGRAGIRTDVTAQSAQVPTNRLRCVTGSEQPYSCDLLRSQAIPSESDTRDWLRALMRSLPGNARYIDVNGRYCDANVCHGLVEGVYTFFDDLHLSATMTLSLDSYFAPSVRRVQ